MYNKVKIEEINKNQTILNTIKISSSEIKHYFRPNSEIDELNGIIFRNSNILNIKKQMLLYLEKDFKDSGFFVNCVGGIKTNPIDFFDIDGTESECSVVFFSHNEEEFGRILKLLKVKYIHNEIEWSILELNSKPKTLII